MKNGTSYRGIIDEVRRQIALRDLAQSLRSIDNIALRLGFSSSQSFHRAFRRWTGDTAASYRDRSRRANALLAGSVGAVELAESLEQVDDGEREEAHA